MSWEPARQSQRCTISNCISRRVDVVSSHPAVEDETRNQLPKPCIPDVKIWDQAAPRLFLRLLSPDRLDHVRLPAAHINKCWSSSRIPRTVEGDLETSLPHAPKLRQDLFKPPPPTHARSRNNLVFPNRPMSNIYTGRLFNSLFPTDVGERKVSLSSAQLRCISPAPG